MVLRRAHIELGRPHIELGRPQIELGRAQIVLGRAQIVLGRAQIVLRHLVQSQCVVVMLGMRENILVPRVLELLARQTSSLFKTRVVMGKQFKTSWSWVGRER